MPQSVAGDRHVTTTGRAQDGGDPVIGVYLHIPFCEYRCTYCDFATFAGEDEYIERYIACLLREIALRARDVRGRLVTSIFFGGGTPSRLPVEAVTRILTSIGECFRVSPGVEVTLEANPGTLDPVKLRLLREAGVTRLSIGVQTLENAILRRVNRIHNADQALEAMRQARAAGYGSVSADLIFGLPGQDCASWQATLRGVLDEKPDHISAYGLILEPGTLLRRQVRAGTIRLPTDDDAAEMYELARRELMSAGYAHYEISNWARPGHRCRHNLLYWEHEPYLGVGLSAHSYLDGVRFANVRGLRSYIGRLEAGRLPTTSSETVGPARARSDAIMLGLRLTRGVHVPTFDSRFGGSLQDSHAATIERLSGYGLLELENGYLRLSKRGYLLANQVWQQFI